MGLDALVVDLLRPTGALHTIIVKPKASRDSLVVAGIADIGPPDSDGEVPVDIGSLRLIDAGEMDVSVFQSRPRQFSRRASSSVYDVQIAHTTIPVLQVAYYLGLPPEWCVCSVSIAETLAGESPRAWTGSHSHVDDSSWIECLFSGTSASRGSLAISVSVDSDTARRSPLPEFGVLHHRHAPVEIVGAAMSGAFAVKIDLKTVVRSLERGVLTLQAPPA